MSDPIVDPSQLPSILLNHNQMVILLKFFVLACCSAGVWVLIRAYAKLTARWKMASFEPDKSSEEFHVSALWLLMAACSAGVVWAAYGVLERLLAPEFCALRDTPQAAWPLMLEKLFRDSTPLW